MIKPPWSCGDRQVHSVFSASSMHVKAMCYKTRCTITNCTLYFPLFCKVVVVVNILFFYYLLPYFFIKWH